MTATPTAHIHLDTEGRAWIDDTNVKVIEVALDQIAWGWTAQEIYVQHDRYLSLAQIHAALSYYYDHQAEYDAEIKRQDEECECAREEQSRKSPLIAKLRAAGKIK
jgi:uncharacterized protein (DUF433 family)